MEHVGTPTKRKPTKPVKHKVTTINSCVNHDKNIVNIMNILYEDRTKRLNKLHKHVYGIRNLRPTH